jgi:hypothetical protein
MSDREDEPTSSRKRRLTDMYDNDADSSDVAGLAAANDDLASSDDDGDDDDEQQDTTASRRRRRVEMLAAQRRRQRLQREIADLHDGDVDFQPAVVTEADLYDVDDEEDPPDYDYEDDNNNNNNDDAEEEDEEGEDLMENAERDYQRIDALDSYGREGIDDREYDAIDIDQRHAAEAEIRARDRQAGRGGRDAGIYGMALDDMEADEDEEARRARRSMFRMEKEDDEQGPDDEEDEKREDDIDEEDLDGEDPINLEAFDVPLQEWLAQGRTKREVQRKFRAFLRHFRPETAGDDYYRRKRANGIYEQKIRNMCASNLASLQISYNHLKEAEPMLLLLGICCSCWIWRRRIIP